MDECNESGLREHSYSKCLERVLDSVDPIGGGGGHQFAGRGGSVFWYYGSGCCVRLRSAIRIATRRPPGFCLSNEENHPRRTSPTPFLRSESYTGVVWTTMLCWSA